MKTNQGEPIMSRSAFGGWAVSFGLKMLLLLAVVAVMTACSSSGGGGGGSKSDTIDSGADENVLPVAEPPQIEDYYPQEGPAGAYVTVWFAKAYDGDLTTLRAYYAGEEIAMVGVSEEAAQLAVPVDAVSGEIRLGNGETKGPGVPFTVLPTTLVPLHEENVGPAADDIVVTADGAIGIVIPPGVLDTTRKLTMARVENPPPSVLAPHTEPVTFDVSIEGLTQLTGEVVIAMKYDPEQLDPEFEAAEQLVVMRWDGQDGVWLPLSYQVNEVDGEIYAVTDHLSLFSFLMLVEAGSRAGEMLLNDIYVTPSGNFRFFYSRSAMDEDPLFGDAYLWSQNRPAVSVPYNIKDPVYLQDIGRVFEDALSNYQNRNLKDPTTTPGWLYGQWHNPVNVKIDSYWSLTTGLGTRDPQYEKIRQRLHFPSGELKNFTADKSSYHVIGHELFHRLQAEYYSILGMRAGTAGSRPANFWWLEATAEFAGSRIAWGNERLSYLARETRADLLSHPLITTGTPTGHNGVWQREYEYAASAFVQFLVEAKYTNFALLIDAVAQGSPLTALNQYFSPSTLADYYVQYAAWAVFADNSHLKNFPIADFSTVAVGNEIAEKKDLLELTADDTLELAVAGGSNVELRVFRGAEGAAARQPGNHILSPDHVLTDGDELLLAPKGNEVLYLLAVNRGTTDTSLNAAIKVTRLVTGSDEEVVTERNHLFALKGNYSARLWAVKVAMDNEFTVQFYRTLFSSDEYPSTFYSTFQVAGLECIGTWVVQDKPVSEALSGVYIRLLYPDGKDYDDWWKEDYEAPLPGMVKATWGVDYCQSKLVEENGQLVEKPNWDSQPRGVYTVKVYDAGFNELVSGQFQLQ